MSVCPKAGYSGDYRQVFGWLVHVEGRRKRTPVMAGQQRSPSQSYQRSQGRVVGLIETATDEPTRRFEVPGLINPSRHWVAAPLRWQRGISDGTWYCRRPAPSHWPRSERLREAEQGNTGARGAHGKTSRLWPASAGGRAGALQ